MTYLIPNPVLLDHNDFYYKDYLADSILLFSMDMFEVFYSYLAIPMEPSFASKYSFREVIEVAHKKKKNLSGLTEGVEEKIYLALQEQKGSQQAKHFIWWVDHIFMIRFVTNEWRDLLVRIKNRNLWNQLELPKHLSQQAYDLFVKMYFTMNDDMVDLMDALYEQAIKKEMSVWDSAVFSRYRFYAENGSPSSTINLVFSQLRYRLFMGWLVQQLSKEELEHFYKTANMLSIQPEYGGKQLPPIETQLIPDMDDSTKIFQGGYQFDE